MSVSALRDGSQGRIFWVVRTALVLAGVIVLAAWSAEKPAQCELGRVQDIEPRSAWSEEFRGNDARIFLQAILGGRTVDPPTVDRILTGEGTAFLVNGECVVSYAFLSAVEYLHGRELVKLFRRYPGSQEPPAVDAVSLEELTKAGDPAAQFHLGVIHGLGQGVPADRRAAVDWLTRSAEQGFEPAMLAVGMALSGPGRLEDEAIAVGKTPVVDEFTDLVAACYWLRRASASQDQVVRREAISELGFARLMERLSPDESARCEQLLKGS